MQAKKVMYRLPATNPSTSGGVGFNFITNENTVSQGGVLGKNLVNGWKHCRVNSNHLEGTNGTADAYDDSYCKVNSFIGSNYRLEAIVFVDGTIDAGIAHETELLARMTENNSQTTLYEGNYAIGGQVTVIKWGGAFNDFNAFTFMTGSGPSSIGRQFQTGDLVRIDVLSGDMTQYVNGSFIFGCHDTSLVTGPPGFGFFARPDPAPNNGNPKFCFSAATVSPLP